MQSTKNTKLPLQLLRIFCALLFFGRAWQHLFWDAPYRTLLWDQRWMEGIVTSLTGWSWEQYVSSSTVDSMIQSGIQFLGGFYLLCGIGCLFLARDRKWVARMIVLGSFSLLLLFLLYWKEQAFQMARLIEFAIQFAAPLLMVLFIREKIDQKQFLRWAKISMALTFLGHAMYAMGYYPVAGGFLDMTINILHVEEPMARKILFIAGVLDILAALLVFFPKTASWALVYMVLWGFLTALARFVGNYHGDFFWSTVHQWMPHLLYRLVHGGLPLVGIMFIHAKPRWKDDLG